MATFQTQAFIQAQLEKGRSAEEVGAFLQKKGFNPNLTSEKFDTGIKGFAKGFGKRAMGSTIDFASLLQGGGQRILAGITPNQDVEDIKKRTGFKSLDKSTAIGRGVQQSVTPKGDAEKAGATTATIAELAVPVGIAGKTKVATGIARGVSKTTGKAVKSTGRAVGNLAVGPEKITAIKTGFKSPSLQKKVLKGEINSNTIAKKVGDAASRLQKENVGRLTASRKRLAGVEKGDEIIARVTKVAKKAQVDAPLLAQEETIVKKLSQFLSKNIKGGQQISRKELDTLVQRIDDAKFFKTGPSADQFANSNKVVNAVRKELRDITKRGNIKFSNLLDKASKQDIPFFKKLGKNIVGPDNNIRVDQLQAKINQLAKAVDDPNTRQESLELLRELAKRVGAKSDFMKELEVFARTQTLTKNQSLTEQPLRAVGGLIERGAAGVARGIGRGVNKTKAVKPVGTARGPVLKSKGVTPKKTANQSDPNSILRKQLSENEKDFIKNRGVNIDNLKLKTRKLSPREIFEQLSESSKKEVLEKIGRPTSLKTTSRPVLIKGKDGFELLDGGHSLAGKLDKDTLIEFLVETFVPSAGPN